MLKKKYLIISLLLLSISFSQNNDNRIINKVSFVGNKLIDSNELKGQIELKPPSVMMFSSIDFDRRLLKLDAINIKNYYNSKGFLEVAVKDSFYVASNQVEIFFLINEGKQFFLKSVNIEGLNSLDNNEILSNLDLFQGQPYNPIIINKKISIIDDLLQEKGKIFSTIDIDQSIQDSVQIVIKVDEGEKVYINDSWISGAERIDTLFVRKEIEFQNGKIFDKKTD
jgi:Outer membrane protein/protective antigen OMA87